MHVLRAAAPGLLIVALVLVPFLDRAFTVDDTVFLLQAEHVLTDPLHPTAFEIVWSDVPMPLRVSAILPTGPVTAWLLLPSVLADGSERIGHLVGLLMLGLAVVMTAALTLRLGGDRDQATAAALLLAASPAALGMAGTCMPDVPAMAFGVLGLERTLAWKMDRRWWQGAVAAAGLALAVLTRTHAVLLLAVAALALVERNASRVRARSWTRWVPPIAALLLALLVLEVTRDPLAPTSGIATAARALSRPSNLAPNVVAFAVHWVLVLPLAVPWMVLHGRRILGGPVAYVAGAAAAIVLARSDGGGWTLVVAPIAGIGIAVLVDTCREAWRSGEPGARWLAAWLLVGLAAAPYAHLPSKYLLVSAPAAALLVARAASRSSRGRPLVASTVALGVVLGLLILRADARFAALGRRAAAELVAPSVAAGGRVWFTGHWGFHWYARRAGARPLTVVPPFPAPGDLAVSSASSTGNIIDLFPRRVHLRRLADASPGGRIMDRRAGAGFYSNAWGYLPWAWGRDELDRFDLWRFE